MLFAVSAAKLLNPSQAAVAIGTGGQDCGRAAAEADWRRCWWRRAPAAATVTEAAADINTRSPKLARLEAALLVAGQPLSPRKLAQFAALADLREVKDLVDQLNACFERSQSTFRVEKLASGYQLLTLPRFAHWLDRLHHRQEHLKLSPPMMETLAVVAYRQPVTRADVEAVRGVQSAEILKQLMERGVVKIVGEDDSLGRPYLYGTTRQFLELYGLTSLNDLPMAATLRRQPEADTPVAETDPAEETGEPAELDAA
jgi:segregation and condensation protein B